MILFAGSVAVRGLSKRVDLERRSVAATVHEVQRYGLIHHRIEATGVSNLNTQSPSERCDGDCALTLCRSVASAIMMWPGAL